MTRFFSLVLLSLFQVSAVAQKDYTQLVNPFIGTGGHGHTYPGASMPFGMMQLSPDTRMADWDGSSGYHYSDSVIYGFSHTHLSGTGIPDYCDLLFMPFTGDVRWNNQEYRSRFSHKNEKAAPGYYEVFLDKHKIKAQLATSYRSGMHQYTFPSTAKDGGILIDLEHRDEVLEAWIEKINDYELRGLRRSKSWAQNQYLYFHIRFEKPIQEFAVLDDAGRVHNTSLMQGKKLKAFVRFGLKAARLVKAKVGISAVSADGAKLNLDTELPHWDFSRVHQTAKTAWNKELGRFEVKGGSREQQVNFYTALYHTFLAPNLFQDVDGSYRSTGGKVRKAQDFTNYSVFSLWDTYRAYHPLMTIINQKRTADWLNTFLHQYHHGGMLPVWELAANETFCMIGYHSVPVILDAFNKGILQQGRQLFLEAMTDYAESNRFGLDHYRASGYISNEKEHESVSKTLEYAYDDWCIAQFARLAGNDSVYRRYIQRAQFYKNLFDPQTKHLRGKIESMWYQPFDPAEINNFYTEGNAWHYSFAAPHDITTLIALHGGKKAFAARLNELFTTSSKTTGRDQADVTGLIGQYAHGNEPSHHMAYLFNYVGMPWRTQELVHQINTQFYRNAPDGLIGNEDCGQMSAWYIFSAMGFYPVNPASGEYVLGAPLFDEVTVRLENGKTFTIKAQRQSPRSKYVSAVAVNGKPQKKSFILHNDIMNGGTLRFIMTDKPNSSFGVADGDCPQAVVNDHPIVAVPYFQMASKKFKGNTEVVLKNMDAEAQIFYRIIQPNIRSVFVRYDQPFIITESCQIEAYSQKGSERSPTVVQNLHKIPNDYAIAVLSKVHPMYTAGGPEALIDGLTGNTNWKTGDWQSYYDTDFEAVVDLKQSRELNYLGIHVLQDVSPWILYPKEVIFYLSDDGNNFKEVARVMNKSDQQLQTIETQELGTKLSGRARYVKVKAVSGGKLPHWHESAGNPSHLFIDEIVIR